MWFFPIKGFDVKSYIFLSLFCDCVVFYIHPHPCSRLWWWWIVQSLVTKNHHHWCFLWELSPHTQISPLPNPSLKIFQKSMAQKKQLTISSGTTSKGKFITTAGASTPSSLKLNHVVEEPVPLRSPRGQPETSTHHGRTRVNSSKYLLIWKRR